MAQPYSGCGGGSSRGEIRAQLEAAGGIEVYCSMRPEIFFFSKATSLSVPDAQAVTRNLKAQLLTAMLTDPLPAVRRVLVRTGEILASGIWHIYDRYQGRDQVDFWQSQSDRFDLVTDPILPRPVYDAVLSYMTAMGHFTTHFLMLSAAIAAASLVLTWGQPLTQVLAWSTLLISAGSIVLSPAAYWAYIVVLHLWAIVFIPFSAAELMATGRSPLWWRWLGATGLPRERSRATPEVRA